MSEKKIITVGNDSDVVVKIAGVEVFTNGSDELFVKLPNNTTFRMCSTSKGLKISAQNFELVDYGSTKGVLLTK